MAEQFGNLFSGLSGVFWQMTGRQKAELLMISIITVVVFVAIALWAGQTEFEVLFYDMESSEAGLIVEKLKEDNVEYKLENGGTKILVPRSNVHELKMSLAQQGIPQSGHVGYEIFDKSNFGMSTFVQKINYKRALEGELARTLNQMSEVKDSRVHIVLPEEKLFKEDKQFATASIILILKSSTSLSKSQISGITRLIASSVEGLKSGQITIIDSHGNTLSKGEESDDLIASSTSQMELQKAVESELIEKSQKMLESVVGIGNAITRVTAELDFESIERTTESFDPDGQVIRSEQFTTTSAIGTDTSQTSKETATTKYEINRTVETLINSAGGIKRLTIAVLINGKYLAVEGSEDNENPEMKYEARSDEEMTKLSNIVKTAVGFQEGRGDKIEVIGMQFASKNLMANFEEMEDSGFSIDYISAAKSVGMIVVAIAVLLVLRSMSKNAGPIRMTSNQRNYPALSSANAGTVTLPTESDFPKLGESILPEAAERTKMHNQISSYSREKSPEATSLLRSWLMED